MQIYLKKKLNKEQRATTKHNSYMGVDLRMDMSLSEYCTVITNSHVKMSGLRM